VLSYYLIRKNTEGGEEGVEQVENHHHHQNVIVVSEISQTVIVIVNVFIVSGLIINVNKNNYIKLYRHIFQRLLTFNIFYILSDDDTCKDKNKCKSCNNLDKKSCAACSGCLWNERSNKCYRLDAKFWW